MQIQLSDIVICGNILQQKTFKLSLGLNLKFYSWTFCSASADSVGTSFVGCQRFMHGILGPDYVCVHRPPHINACTEVYLQWCGMLQSRRENRHRIITSAASEPSELSAPAYTQWESHSSLNPIPIITGDYHHSDCGSNACFSRSDRVTFFEPVCNLLLALSAADNTPFAA